MGGSEQRMEGLRKGSWEGMVDRRGGGGQAAWGREGGKLVLPTSACPGLTTAAAAPFLSEPTKGARPD